MDSVTIKSHKGGPETIQIALPDGKPLIFECNKKNGFQMTIPNKITYRDPFNKKGGVLVLVDDFAHHVVTEYCDPAKKNYRFDVVEEKVEPDKIQPEKVEPAKRGRPKKETQADETPT